MVLSERALQMLQDIYREAELSDEDLQDPDGCLEALIEAIHEDLDTSIHAVLINTLEMVSPIYQEGLKRKQQAAKQSQDESGKPP